MDLDQPFKKWCKLTKRSGGVLIGSSIRELLEEISKYVTTMDRTQYSEAYLNWVHKQKDIPLPLTSSQHIFAEFCFKYSKMIPQIGNMEIVFKSIRNGL